MVRASDGEVEGGMLTEDTELKGVVWCVSVEPDLPGRYGGVALMSTYRVAPCFQLVARTTTSFGLGELCHVISCKVIIEFLFQDLDAPLIWTLLKLIIFQALRRVKSPRDVSVAENHERCFSTLGKAGKSRVLIT